MSVVAMLLPHDTSGFTVFDTFAPTMVLALELLHFHNYSSPLQHLPPSTVPKTT